MSSVEPEVDLSALARPEPALAPPKRSKLRFLVPLILLVGFGAVIASTLTDVLRPVHDVTVVRPVRPNADQIAALDEAAVTVQASGWIEPDPFPIHVTALAAGVVEEMLVQESDVIEAGAVIARLIDEDARIAKDAASAELAIREAELAQAEARRDIAVERLEEALAVTEARDATRALHEGAAAAATLRAAAVQEGESRVSIARDEVLVQRELEAAGTSGVRQVELAEGALEEAHAVLAGLRADEVLARSKVVETKARMDRAERDFELRLDDRLERDLAETQVQHAKAEVRKARATLEEAELRLSRMEVRASAGGVVLQRLVVPGMVLSPAFMGHEVCALYDPRSLRVRVDVPQPEVERIFVGQRAEIECESRRRRPYGGEVLRVVSQANLSKVTLEVHVRIDEPDGLVRPEMLAQVRFFGAPGGEEPTGTADAGRAADVVLVPARLVEQGAVWVVGAGGTAERRAIEVGAARGELVEARAGLNLTDKLVDVGREALSQGDRLRVGRETR